MKLLIIGKGDTTYKLNQVLPIQNSKTAMLYGEEGELSEACLRALTYADHSIYACNVHTLEDYFEVIPQIRQNQFDFITPISLFFDTSFQTYDGQVLKALIVFIEQVELANARFFITDRHASLFQTVEQFISHYEKLAYDIKHTLNPLYFKNVSIIANHLEESLSANVDAAMSFIISTPGHFPQATFGTTLYQLEQTDFIHPIVYFRENTLIPTTIENLFHLEQKGLEANLVIQNMLIYINQLIDLDRFKTRFHPVILNEIKRYVEEVLVKCQGAHFEKYSIEDIILTKESIGFSIEVITHILPFFSHDYISTSVKRGGS